MIGVAKECVEHLGMSYTQTAKALGVDKSTIGRWDRDGWIKRSRPVAKPKASRRKVQVNMVPVQRLREAVQRSYETRCQICVRIGWAQGETSRLARRLGETLQNGAKSHASMIEEPLALKILSAIHLDPVDVGI